MKTSKKILVPLAQGFEEAEFIGIVDVLRRASELSGNLEVIIASLNSELLVKGANGIVIKADYSLKDVDIENLDAIALAGGYEGMNNLKNSNEILNIIQNLHSNGKIVAAICASPIVLNAAGILEGEFACYPGCEVGLNGTRINKAVNINKNIITSAGPATAILFGLELAKHLCSVEIYNSLYEGMLVPLVK
ncbi:DJ-1 family glyoxalase III [Campylobacter aviculae]|uniref:DJ-1 family protein n=1 Tax=Campylobacter aviculae TaxID=2510190 RepID=A0A4U7BV82_9BACT|nr:DJ-1 family glyoxalase III [Campylobacter aviculae]TKX32357.1 DJ-1 family protein [Campylobacter aviculae]